MCLLLFWLSFFDRMVTIVLRSSLSTIDNLLSPAPPWLLLLCLSNTHMQFTMITVADLPFENLCNF